MSARVEVLRRLLEASPADAGNWHALALEQAALEQWDAAVRHFEEAVRLRPKAADFRANLALACGRSGNWARAAEEYRHAVDLRPGHAGSLAKLGRALVRCGSVDEGIAWLERAVDAENSPDHHNALGAALAEAGRWEDAARCFLRAAQAGHDEARENAAKLASGYLERGAKAAGERNWQAAHDAFAWAARLAPESAEAHFHLGLAQSGLGQLNEATRSYETAAALRPDYAEAWNNRAHVELALGNAARAIELARQAIALRPGYVDAHYNLGVILQNQGDATGAREAFHSVLALSPGHADALNNLGTMQLALNRFDGAMEQFDQALAADPGHIDARWNRSLALLVQGKWTEGWREYAVRLRRPEYQRHFAAKRWTGEALTGRSLLVWAEQGLGDTLQFLRFVPELVGLGAAVTLETQDRLVPLLAASGFHTVARGTPVVTDFEVPLMSLPGLLGARPGALPAPAELDVPGDRMATWQNIVGQSTKIRVGLVWGAQAANLAGRSRSLPLTVLEPLSRLAGIEWISLQQGPQTEELAACPWVRRFEEPTGDVLDTAALMMHLDLIITVDTMTAHLAGSLGRPVWTLLPYAADWRWMQASPPSEPAATAWYPSMKLFRQPGPGDWAGTVAQVSTALAALASNRVG